MNFLVQFGLRGELFLLRQVSPSTFDLCSDKDCLKILGENENTVFFKLTYIIPYEL